MAAANNSIVNIIQTSSVHTANADSLECVLCHRKFPNNFTQISALRNHYWKSHQKHLMVMPKKKGEVSAPTKVIKKKRSRTNDEEKSNPSECEKRILVLFEDPLEKKKEFLKKFESLKDVKTKSNHTVKLTVQSKDETFHVKKEMKEEPVDDDASRVILNTSLGMEKQLLLHSQKSKNKYIDDTNRNKPIIYANLHIENSENKYVDNTNISKSIECAENGECSALNSVNNHKQKQTPKCDHCNESFDSLELNFLKTHVCSKRKENDKYDKFSDCTLCGKTLKNLKAHAQVVHGLKYSTNTRYDGYSKLSY